MKKEVRMKGKHPQLLWRYIGAPVLLLICSCLILPDSKATSAEESKPLFNEGSPFRQIAEDVLPSVVNISAEKIVKKQPHIEFDYPFHGFDFPFEDFFKNFKERFRELPPYFEGKKQSLGSGVIISEDGYILTNNHVISGADRVVVTCYDKAVYRGDEVQIVGKDPRTDLAVLKIDTERKLQPAKLGDSDEIEIGDWAIAIGNPFGFRGTVTTGVISAKGRSGVQLPEGPDQQDFIQTDASINPGNSGGPLLNIRGEIIGINTAIASRTGYWQGIGFAIPVNLAKSVYQQLIEEGRVVRGWLGVYIQEVTGDLIEAFGANEGVLVNEVIAGSPAQTSGLGAGDIIVAFDGKGIESVPQLQSLVSETPPGTEVRIDVLRDGREKELKVVLGEMPEELAGVEPEEKSSNAGWLGLEVVPLDDVFAEPYDVEAEEGVLVTQVELGSPAHDAGIRPGDVLVEVDRKRIKDMKSYEKVRSELESSTEEILFYVQRGDRKRFVVVTPE